jgi:hypothetical protein
MVGVGVNVGPDENVNDDVGLDENDEVAVYVGLDVGLDENVGVAVDVELDEKVEVILAVDVLDIFGNYTHETSNSILLSCLFSISLLTPYRSRHSFSPKRLMT